jgi:hypothetical protein
VLCQVVYVAVLVGLKVDGVASSSSSFSIVDEWMAGTPPGVEWFHGGLPPGARLRLTDYKGGAGGRRAPPPHVVLHLHSASASSRPNLRYEPRDIDSLTAAEMKCILQMIYNDSLKIVEYISHCIERITFERQYIISMKSRNIDSLIHI